MSQAGILHPDGRTLPFLSSVVLSQGAAHAKATQTGPVCIHPSRLPSRPRRRLEPPPSLTAGGPDSALMGTRVMKTPLIRRIWPIVFSMVLVVPSTLAESFPWRVYAGQPGDWYRGYDGSRIADNVLSHQSERGDWPKNIDTSKTPYQGDRSRLQGTFDNGATIGEIRFLARAFVAADRRGIATPLPRPSIMCCPPSIRAGAGRRPFRRARGMRDISRSTTTRW